MHFLIYPEEQPHEIGTDNPQVGVEKRDFIMIFPVVVIIDPLKFVSPVFIHGSKSGRENKHKAHYMLPWLDMVCSCNAHVDLITQCSGRRQAHGK